MKKLGGWEGGEGIKYIKKNIYKKLWGVVQGELDHHSLQLLSKSWEVWGFSRNADKGTNTHKQTNGYCDLQNESAQGWIQGKQFFDIVLHFLGYVFRFNILNKKIYPTQHQPEDNIKGILYMYIFLYVGLRFISKAKHIRQTNSQRNFLSLAL